MNPNAMNASLLDNFRVILALTLVTFLVSGQEVTAQLSGEVPPFASFNSIISKNPFGTPASNREPQTPIETLPRSDEIRTTFSKLWKLTGITNVDDTLYASMEHPNPPKRFLVKEGDYFGGPIYVDKIDPVELAIHIVKNDRKEIVTMDNSSHAGLGGTISTSPSISSPIGQAPNRGIYSPKSVPSSGIQKAMEKSNAMINPGIPLLPGPQSSAEDSILPGMPTPDLSPTIGGRSKAELEKLLRGGLN